MSKLKRRKTAVEEIKHEQQFTIKDQNQGLRIPDATLHSRHEGSPAGGGSSCWTSSDLLDVEKLWMETLNALCPQFRAQDTTLCVPPLPPLATKEEKPYEQRWCSLDEDVIPFPNPLAPCALAHSAPFPFSPMSGHDLQDRAGCFSSHSECEQDVNRVAAGKSGSGTEASGPKCEGEAGAGTLDTSEIKSRAMPGVGMTPGSEPEINNEAGMSGRGSGSDGLRLKCCPMCLMPFPAKFSQMECDGHLAQCLSEMNADMMW